MEQEVEESNTCLEDHGSMEIKFNAFEKEEPPAIYVQYPLGTIAVALNESLLPEQSEGETEPLEPKEILLPEALTEREDAETYEANYRLVEPEFEQNLQHLRTDLKRRKRIFLLFLSLDFIYCIALVVAQLALNSDSGVTMLPLLIVLANNMVVIVLTFYGVYKSLVWILNLFILVEGFSIGLFLFVSFSPLVVLRLLVMLMCAQLRARILLLRRYEDFSMV